MNKNIKHLLEYIVNEENIQLTNKLNNNGDFLNNIITYFKTNFKPQILVNIKIKDENIKNNDFYKAVMINIASQLIEYYVANFMLNMFKSKFKFNGNLIFDEDKDDENNKITIKRGRVHDFIVQFKNDDKDDFYNQPFEIKSYNKEFGNITLTDNQRKISNIGTPIYVLCNYDLNDNAIIITDIDLVLGSNLLSYLLSKSLFNNDKAGSRHISKDVGRINIYKREQEQLNSSTK